MPTNIKMAHRSLQPYYALALFQIQPMFSLPRTATAPFCPSEVKGSIEVPPGLPLHKKLMRFAGPGLLVSVGYMDPGN